VCDASDINDPYFQVLKLCAQIDRRKYIKCSNRACRFFQVRTDSDNYRITAARYVEFCTEIEHNFTHTLRVNVVVS